MRAVPNARVVSWLNAQAADTLYLSTVSLAELLLGIAVLSDGRRKSDLISSLANKAAEMFGPRLLSFDPASAEAYALLVSRARAAGRSIGLADGLIAAIAAAHDFAVATRDISPFSAAGVRVIDPWSDP